MMKTHIGSDRWGRRERLIAVIIIGCLILLALVLTDRADASQLAGNKGGCGTGNMITLSCNVSDAGQGFVSGKCEYGHWFSRVSTARVFTIGQVVTARGCEGLNGELYAPIRISK